MPRAASISFFLCSFSCIKEQYVDFFSRRAEGGVWVGESHVYCSASSNGRAKKTEGVQF